MLFRWRGGDAFELVRDAPVIAVDAQRLGGGYVVASRTPNFAGRPVDFDAVWQGGVERRLSFDQGYVSTMSASERLDTIVFDSFRRVGDEGRFWVHREGMAQAVDLNVAERLRREVGFQIQREANEAAASERGRPALLRRGRHGRQHGAERGPHHRRQRSRRAQRRLQPR